jgi:hypothetical protein
VEGSLQLHGNDSRMVDDCCKKCNNKEMIRALNTNNRILFDSILNSKQKIVSLKEKPGVDSNSNILSLCLEQENDYYFERIVDILYNDKKEEFRQNLFAEPDDSR